MLIGIDIGGTNIRLGIVSREGKILVREKVAVGFRKSPQEMIFIVESLVRKLSSKKGGKPLAIGIGVPGIISASSGIVYSSPHYPMWKNFSLARRLSRKLKIPVVMDNDANMIARGEQWMGAGKEWKHFLMVTLGTGIGGGIVIDSEVFLGTRGFAGEFGHMNVKTDGAPCGCGSRGCWETMASASGICRLIGEAIKEEVDDSDLLKDLATCEPRETARLLAAYVKKGNRAASAIFETFARYLGIGLASLVNVTGIEKIVLGGGLMGAKDLFLEKAKEELKKRIYAKTFEGIEIVPASLGDDAGILGSAKMAMQKTPR